jgi:PAS domain S-box-containing protein
MTDEQQGPSEQQGAATQASSHSILVGLDEVLITDELAKRPVRPPDHKAEAYALSELARELAASPGAVLQRLVDLIVETGMAGSAGVSIFRPGEEGVSFQWSALAGAWAEHLGGIMPFDESPCGVVVARNTPLLFSRPHAHFPAAHVEPLIHEILLVPFHVWDEPVGTLWAIAHDPERAFDSEDLRLLTQLARFASAAHQTVDALKQAQEARDLLEARVEARTAALRETEDRQAFLLSLSDTLRPLTDAAEIAGVAARQLGERLNVNRVCYGEIEGETLRIRRDHARDVPSIMGEHSLEPFGRSFLAAYQPGRIVAVSDVDAEPRLTPLARSELQGRSIAAFADLVLTQDERWVSILAVQHASPRVWTEPEQNLIREVGERVRVAVERARVEAALRASEARLRLIVENARDYAILTSDHDDRITDWWAGATNVFGWTAEEAIGQPAAILFTPEDREAGQDVHETRTALREGSAPNVRWHLHKNGSRVFIEGVTNALHDAEGRFRGFLKIGQDVTERRAIEERLRSALAIRTVGVVFWGPDFRLSEANDAFLQMSGFSRDEALGTPWQELTPEEFHPASLQAIEELRTRGEATPYEKQYLRNDGSRWWGLCAPRRLDSETVEFVLDVTERRRAEEALHESEARFQQFGEASPDLVWIRDAMTMQFEYVSPAFEAIYGQSRAAVLEGDTLERWADLIHPEDRERALMNLERVRTGERVTQGFRIVRPSDGEIRWIEDTGFPLVDAAGRVQRVAGIAKDVTEQKASAARLEVLVNELQHRSRNLLGVITAVASSTLTQGGSVANFQARLQALSRAQGLLSQFGSDTVEVGALVHMELAAHAEIRPPKVKASGPKVHLTARQVQNFALALHELATNAVKYGALKGDTGQLAVTWLVTRDQRDRPHLTLSWIESGVPIQPDTVTRRGYGRELIENALSYALNAKTEYVLGDDGVHCRIELPLS